LEVVGFVDRRGEGLPWGILLKTKLGEKEINEVWLTGVDEPGPGEGYSPDVALDETQTPPFDRPLKG
jgi:hypothetical protein